MDGKPERSKWKGISIISVLSSICLITVGALITIAPRFALTSEFDNLQQSAVSPDGAYKAELIYRENRGMTYGYYRVAITSKDSDLHQATEVAAEGLNGIAWKGSRLLEIFFNATKNARPEEDTLFVQQDTKWRDVTIVYIPEK